MRRWLLSLLVMLPLSAAADEALVGLGYMNGLVGPNLEWATDHNSFHVLPSTYIGNGGAEQDEFRWVAGWRHKMERGRMDEDGFYLGLLAGDLGGERHYERLGAGVELGHQWVKDFTRWTFSGAVGVLEPLDCSDHRGPSDCNTQEERDLHELDAEPTVVLGISVSLRR